MVRDNFPMEVFLCEPHGLCVGVKRALEIASKARKENEGPIHVLGSLIHNETIMGELEAEGFIFHSENRLVLEEEMRDLPLGSIVLFPAHGHDSELDELAKEKEFKVYDAACPFVKSNMDLIKKSIKEGHGIVYVGRKGHAEAEACLSLSPSIALYDVKGEDDGRWKKMQDRILVLVQTTLAEDDVEKAFASIKERYRCAIFANRPCLATKERQEALKGVPNDISAFVIIGSPRSNNTMALLQMAKALYPHAECVLALDLDELKKKSLPKGGKVALTSGASTPESVFLQIKEYLESL